jgi:EpsI family protein
MFNRYSVILTAVLAAQAAGYYLIPHTEVATSVPPLALLPGAVPDWKATAEFPLDPEVNRVLQADDSLNRNYESADGAREANLFIAYFQTQRTGKTPHSPKHCMPGNGWEPIRSDKMRIDVPNVPGGIEVNHFVLLKGREKMVVLYWYQTTDRVIASEYKAKVYTVIDSIRKRRSDTALVRVIVRRAGAEDEETAAKVGAEFVRSIFSSIQGHFAG